jgi:hypothetical protein
MSSIGIFFLMLFAVLAALVIIAYIAVRRKIVRGVASLKVLGLEAAEKELKQAQSQATEPDAERDALLARVEAAHAAAKAAYAKGDMNAVSRVADPVLKELLEAVQKKVKAEEARREAERQAHAQGALPPAGEGDRPALLPPAPKGDEPEQPAGTEGGGEKK